MNSEHVSDKKKKWRVGPFPILLISELTNYTRADLATSIQWVYMKYD